MDQKQKNVPLIIALSIPVLMIILVAVSVYLPALFVQPEIDFVFSMGGGHCYQNKYSVKEGQVIENEIKPPEENSYCHNYREPRLYFYDVQADKIQEMTLAEAQKFILDPNLQSADGFEVVPGGGGDIFFFSGSSYHERYIKKGAFSRKLKTGACNYYEFHFLGWVKEGGNG